MLPLLPLLLALVSARPIARPEETPAPPSEVNAPQDPASLPADLPVELPAESPAESPAELPTESYLSTDLPADLPTESPNDQAGQSADFADQPAELADRPDLTAAPAGQPAHAPYYGANYIATPNSPAHTAYAPYGPSYGNDYAPFGPWQGLPPNAVHAKYVTSLHGAPPPYTPGYTATDEGYYVPVYTDEEPSPRDWQDTNSQYAAWTQYVQQLSNGEREPR